MIQIAPVVTKFSPSLDTGRRYLTDSPSPSSFASALKDVDAGDIAAIVELNEEMEAKDGHLQAVSSRRRESLTALEWCIQPDSTARDQAAAQSGAAYCQTELMRLQSWPGALEHLALAIGPGISVVELVWHRGRLVDTINVPGHRLQGDLLDQSSAIFVRTEDALSLGVRTSHGMPNPKFIVYTPNARAGFPLRVTITRAQAYLWVIKHFAQADWAGFAETYGQPVRVAKVDGEISAKEKTALEKMLKNMGSDLYAMFSDNIDLQFLEAARTTQPFEGMIDWIERKQSILYLGQTLTTEQGNVGSLALGHVHENVRASITLSDIKKEARTIREEVLKPMIQMRFPGAGIPIPTFVRKVAEEKDIEGTRLSLDVLRFMREAGLPVDPEHVYDLLNVPQPKG